ncbi:hypothetical protein ACFSCX_19345 [Bacillus salitolerans]|uniref:Lipoprotein n=1 Tax=Bacillus salitolerans TaxID=1437434 RepID=A0ABW4LUD5_9BACI
MRIIVVIVLGLGLLLAGCSDKASVTEVAAYKAEDIPFEGGIGRVTIAFEEPILKDGKIVDGLIDVIVFARELKSGEEYEIYIGEENKRGVIFGPEENVELRFGTLIDETFFHPNAQGELFVSMKNPLRIFSKVEEVRVFVSQDGQEVLKSEPFKFLENTP